VAASETGRCASSQTSAPQASPNTGGAGEELQRRGDEQVVRQPRARRGDLAERLDESGEHEHEQPADRHRLAPATARDDEQRHTGEAQGHADQRQATRPLAGERGTTTT
jgi:hypothetical protein